MTDSLTCSPGFHLECVADPAPVLVWRDLGQPPAIASVITQTGRTICCVIVFHGRALLCYGDWTANQPKTIDVIAYDIAAGAFTTLRSGVPTFAIWTMREVDGALWALCTDPSEGTDPDAVIIQPDGSTSLLSGGLSAAHWHPFDAVSFGGTQLLAGGERVKLPTGNEVSYAAIWRKQPRAKDGVLVWEVVHRLKDTSRMYAFFTLKDRLWAVDSRGRSWSSGDGANWTAEPYLFPPTTTKPLPYGGGVVFRSDWPALGTGGLYAFDGTDKPKPIVGKVRDHAVSGGWLYTLANEAIQREGVHITTAPPNAVSLAIDGDTIYCGTADSKLWSYGP